MKNGKYIESNGTVRWYKNGHIHREDGPASISNDGTKGWLIEGKLHRLDGPALEWSTGEIEWWIQGKHYTKINFNNYLIQNNLDKILT